MLPSPSDKAQFLINTFLKILILVKNVINNLNLLKASVPNCILVVVLKNFEPQLSYVLDDLVNMCLQEYVFPDCWNVSSEVPVLKIYHEKLPTGLLCVVSKVFKRLANNKFVDHLEKCGLFFQYNFRSYWSTADPVYLIELIGLLIDLMLVKLRHVIYPRLLIKFIMLVFFISLSLTKFWINYLTLIFSQE